MFQDVVHHARQFYPKVHRTSVTCDVMRRRRANARPRGRGNVEAEVEANLCNVSKDVILSHPCDLWTWSWAMATLVCFVAGQVGQNVHVGTVDLMELYPIL